MKYRRKAAAMFVAAAAMAASAGLSPTATAAAGSPSDDHGNDHGSVSAPWWQKKNGVRVFFLTCTPGDVTLNSITTQIPDLRKRGYRVLDIFAAYHGEHGLNPDGSYSDSAFCGLAPLDYFHTDPALGTDADWRRLVSTAHANGISVFSWMNLGYGSTQTEF